MKAIAISSALALSVFMLSTPAQLYAQTHIAPEASQSWLGRGINSATGLLKSSCVTGDVSVVNNQTMTMGYLNAKTASQSLAEVTGKVGASVNLGLFGGGASVSMHTRLEETTNTASLVFRMSYKGNDLTLENRQLTTTGQQAVAQNAAAIYDECGDAFIHHLQLGNELYFVTQMTFATREDYQQFVTKIKIRVLFFKKTITITDEFFEYGQNGVYSVRVLSPNPLPEQVKNILGPDGESHCGPDGDSDPTTWMNACVDQSNSVMDYLISQNNDPLLSYSAWLADESNLGVNYYNSSNYVKSGHFEFDQVTAQPATELLALNTRLLDELTEQYREHNVLKAYANSTRTDKTDYHARLNDVNNNIYALELAMDRCAQQMQISSCQIEVDNAFSGLIE